MREERIRRELGEFNMRRNRFDSDDKVILGFGCLTAFLGLLWWGFVIFVIVALLIHFHVI